MSWVDLVCLLLVTFAGGVYAGSRMERKWPSYTGNTNLGENDGK